MASGIWVLIGVVFNGFNYFLNLFNHFRHVVEPNGDNIIIHFVDKLRYKRMKKRVRCIVDILDLVFDLKGVGFTLYGHKPWYTIVQVEFG